MSWQTAVTVVQEAEPPFIPAGAHAMTMLCHPGQPMLVLVDDDELAARRDRRAK
jgi:hypothetical protein